MPDRSLSFAAYLSRRHGNGGGGTLGDMPPRPSGSVVWARVYDKSQLSALRDLEEELRADGDQITLIVTLSTPTGQTTLTPNGRSQVRAFLDHWSPDLVLWLEADLDTITLFELSELGIPCMLVGATADALRPTAKGWVPGLTRAMLRQFRTIMTVDDETRMAAIRNGADPKRIETLGVLESAPAALSHFEDERQDIAKVLGARSVWLAADTDLAEIAQIAKAHHQASRRAHRLLLIVSLRAAEEGAKAAEILRDVGLSVALRSADEEPGEATQVYVADTEGELGLWYRIAPITYLGCSLSGGPCRDPFEAATLGSAVLLGPDVAPYEPQKQRLVSASACVSIQSFAELGNTVEILLSPDKTARIVHAAWDVTSRGADVTNRLAEAVMDTLDGIRS